ncbi:head-tail adaptor protein [Streptomyces sp. M2CJ-2]|uniref:phage head completion protein n=1 Tax=Streptomyces sp. M2CJ-2 TaxID=2803948 RepID=UPI001923C0B2|nr:head-tail adaptor protein [Streptomyces sp. M2CJ-2]MBL3664529.1 head-tail adaptor protein [Streptomyces sp. M2CJ-2]
MPGHIGRQTVTLLDAPLVTEAYNKQVRDWDAATETEVRRVTVDYTGSSETKNASDQTVTTARLFMPPRAPRVTEWMRVKWQDRTWDVDGVPAEPEGAGPLSGQVVDLKEVAG